MNAGIRFSRFDRLGQSELSYANNRPIVYNAAQGVYSEAEPIGTTSASRSESLSTFNNFEPRISFSYSLTDNAVVKASYNRMAQYLHLLSNTSSPTPLDIWTPSGPYVQPQLLDQFAAGYFTDIKEGAYRLEVESFYKTVQNRIDYVDGANLIANDAIEQVILNGEARAYGLEVLFKKDEGRFNGWFAYTLSRSEQRTQGFTMLILNQ